MHDLHVALSLTGYTLWCQVSTEESYKMTTRHPSIILSHSISTKNSSPSMLIGLRIQNFLHIKDVSISLDPSSSQFIGLVGRRAGGKTTLLKAISFLRWNSIFPEELNNAKVTAMTNNSIFCRCGESSFKVGPLELEISKMVPVEKAEFFHLLDMELKIYFIENSLQYSMSAAGSSGFGTYLVTQAKNFYKGFFFSEDQYHGGLGENPETALEITVREELSESEPMIELLNKEIKHLEQEISSGKAYLSTIQDARDRNKVDVVTNLITSLKINLFNYYIAQKQKLMKHQPLFDDSPSLRDMYELNRTPVKITLEELNKGLQETEVDILVLEKEIGELKKARKVYQSLVTLPYHAMASKPGSSHGIRTTISHACAFPNLEKLLSYRPDHLRRLSKCLIQQRDYVNQSTAELCVLDKKLRSFHGEVLNQIDVSETSLNQIASGSVSASCILESLQKLDRRFIGSIFDSTVATDKAWIPYVQSVYHHMSEFYVIVEDYKAIKACGKILRGKSEFINEIMRRAGENRPLTLIARENCERYKGASFPLSLRRKYRTATLLSNHVSSKDPRFNSVVKYVFRKVLYVPELRSEDTDEFIRAGLCVIQSDRRFFDFSSSISYDFSSSGKYSSNQKVQYDLSDTPELKSKLSSLIQMHRSVTQINKDILETQEKYILLRTRNRLIVSVLAEISYAKKLISEKLHTSDNKESERLKNISEHTNENIDGEDDDIEFDGTENDEIERLLKASHKHSQENDFPNTEWENNKKHTLKLSEKLCAFMIKRSEIRFSLARRRQQDNTERLFIDRLDAQLTTLWKSLPDEVVEESLQLYPELEKGVLDQLKSVRSGSLKYLPLEAQWTPTCPLVFRLKDPYYSLYIEFIAGVEPTESFLMNNIEILTGKRNILHYLVSQKDDDDHQKLEILKTRLDDLIKSKYENKEIVRNAYRTLYAINAAKHKRLKTVIQVLTPFCQYMYQYLNEGVGARISFEPVTLTNLDVSLQVRAASNDDGPLRDIHVLSSGEKTIFLLAMQLAVALSHSNTLLLMDKLDHSLDKRLRNRVGQAIQGLIRTGTFQCIMTVDSGPLIEQVDLGIGAYIDCRLPNKRNVRYCLYKNHSNPSQNQNSDHQNNPNWPILQEYLSARKAESNLLSKKYYEQEIHVGVNDTDVPAQKNAAVEHDADDRFVQHELNKGLHEKLINEPKSPQKNLKKKEDSVPVSISTNDTKEAVPCNNQELVSLKPESENKHHSHPMLRGRKRLRRKVYEISNINDSLPDLSDTPDPADIPYTSPPKKRIGLSPEVPNQEKKESIHEEKKESIHEEPGDALVTDVPLHKKRRTLRSIGEIMKAHRKPEQESRISKSDTEAVENVLEKVNSNHFWPRKRQSFRSISDAIIAHWKTRQLHEEKTSKSVTEAMEEANSKTEQSHERQYSKSVTEAMEKANSETDQSNWVTPYIDEILRGNNNLRRSHESDKIRDLTGLSDYIRSDDRSIDKTRKRIIKHMNDYKPSADPTSRLNKSQFRDAKYYDMEELWLYHEYFNQEDTSDKPNSQRDAAFDEAVGRNLFHKKVTKKTANSAGSSKTTESLEETSPLDPRLNIYAKLNATASLGVASKTNVHVQEAQQNPENNGKENTPQPSFSKRPSLRRTHRDSLDIDIYGDPSSANESIKSTSELTKSPTSIPGKPNSPTPRPTGVLKSEAHNEVHDIDNSEELAGSSISEERTGDNPINESSHEQDKPISNDDPFVSPNHPRNSGWGIYLDPVSNNLRLANRNNANSDTGMINDVPTESPRNDEQPSTPPQEP